MLIIEFEEINVSWVLTKHVTINVLCVVTEIVAWKIVVWKSFPKSDWSGKFRKIHKKSCSFTGKMQPNFENF